MMEKHEAYLRKRAMRKAQAEAEARRARGDADPTPPEVTLPPIYDPADVGDSDASAEPAADQPKKPPRQERIKARLVSTKMPVPRGADRRVPDPARPTASASEMPTPPKPRGRRRIESIPRDMSWTQAASWMPGGMVLGSGSPEASAKVDPPAEGPEVAPSAAVAAPDASRDADPDAPGATHDTPGRVPRTSPDPVPEPVADPVSPVTETAPEAADKPARAASPLLLTDPAPQHGALDLSDTEATIPEPEPEPEPEPQRGVELRPTRIRMAPAPDPAAIPDPDTDPDTVPASSEATVDAGTAAGHTATPDDRSSPAALPAIRGWTHLPRARLYSRTLENNRIISAMRHDPAHVAFDILRTRLLTALKENGWHRVAVTSPTKDCGKTFVTANLAVALSRQETVRTVALDFDLRNPALGASLGIEPLAPMADLLSGKRALRDHLQVPESNDMNIGSNLALGLNNRAESFAAELLSSSHVPDLLAEIDEALTPDVVLFDMPPALFHDDVIALRPQFDGVLLVVGGGITKPQEIREVKRRLGDQTPLLGVVMNKAEGLNATDYSY